MLGSARLAWAFAAILTLLAGACGSTPPRDVNYGTDLGADFRPPMSDAGSDTAVTSTGGSAGTAGAGGAAGDTGGSGGDTGGTAGDTGGAAGAAGAGT
ncbi:MAG TPA: hypothetical protein VMT03_15750 [Polyangia bacterium]|nr:hypothetical protein [Polyangia bacterium]